MNKKSLTLAAGLHNNYSNDDNNKEKSSSSKQKKLFIQEFHFIVFLAYLFLHQHTPSFRIHLSCFIRYPFSHSCSYTIHTEYIVCGFLFGVRAIARTNNTRKLLLACLHSFSYFTGCLCFMRIFRFLLFYTILYLPPSRFSNVLLLFILNCKFIVFIFLVFVVILCSCELFFRYCVRPVSFSDFRELFFVNSFGFLFGLSLFSLSLCLLLSVCIHFYSNESSTRFFVSGVFCIVCVCLALFVDFYAVCFFLLFFCCFLSLCASTLSIFFIYFGCSCYFHIDTCVLRRSLARFRANFGLHFGRSLHLVCGARSPQPLQL